jgi:hypothetical protein
MDLHPYDTKRHNTTCHDIVVYECNLIRCVYIFGFKEGRTRGLKKIHKFTHMCIC